MGKVSESIAALNTLLEFDTTDAEAWAELSDMYLSEGLYPQAIYALEEVLVLTPNAWNVGFFCVPDITVPHRLTFTDICSTWRSLINGCQHVNGRLRAKVSRRGAEAFRQKHRTLRRLPTRILWA